MGNQILCSLDNVKIVLSGMSSLEQMNDNTSYMDDFKKINKEEEEIIEKVSKILKQQIAIEYKMQQLYRILSKTH